MSLWWNYIQANQPQDRERIGKQKQELLKLMQERTHDLETADGLFLNTLELLSGDQLDALADLLMNEYETEEEE